VERKVAVERRIAMERKVRIKNWTGPNKVRIWIRMEEPERVTALYSQGVQLRKIHDKIIDVYSYDW